MRVQLPSSGKKTTFLSDHLEKLLQWKRGKHHVTKMNHDSQVSKLQIMPCILDPFVFPPLNIATIKHKNKLGYLSATPFHCSWTGFWGSSTAPNSPSRQQFTIDTVHICGNYGRQQPRTNWGVYPHTVSTRCGCFHPSWRRHYNSCDSGQWQ